MPPAATDIPRLESPRDVLSHVEEEVEINLRSSCLRCRFLSSCPVVEEKVGPESDVLIGTYRASALIKRCLL